MLVFMTDDTKTIACVLFPGVDPLDLIGPMQALGLLAYLQPDWQVVTVAERIEAINTESSLLFTPSHTFGQITTHGCWSCRVLAPRLSAR